MSSSVVSPHRPQEDEGSGALPSGCPMSGLLAMITRPWTLHILWLLSNEGPMRFGALRRGVSGISARLLAVRLRTLETEGFVRRTVRPGKVPEVTYTPTSRLADMQEFMEQLHRLSAKWQEEDMAAGRYRGQPEGNPTSGTY